MSIYGDNMFRGPGPQPETQVERLARALAASQAEVSAMKEELARMELGLGLITEERDAYRKSGESIAAEHVKVCAGFNDRRVAHLKAQEALIVAAASLERARAALREIILGTPNWSGGAARGTARRALADMSPPTPIATPGAEAKPMACCKEGAKLSADWVARYKCPTHGWQGAATPGTPTEEET